MFHISPGSLCTHHITQTHTHRCVFVFYVFSLMAIHIQKQHYLTVWHVFGYGARSARTWRAGQKGRGGREVRQAGYAYRKQVRQSAFWWLLCLNGFLRRGRWVNHLWLTRVRPTLWDNWNKSIVQVKMVSSVEETGWSEAIRATPGDHCAVRHQ